MRLVLSSLSELPETGVSEEGSLQSQRSKCRPAIQAASGRSDIGGGSLIPAFDAYLLSPCCVPKTVLGVGNTAVKGLQHVESHTLLCLRLMDLPVIHIEAQPSQQSKEEKGKGFTCHISTKTRYSKVTKLTEIANEEGAQRITGGSILNTS